MNKNIIGFGYDPSAAPEHFLFRAEENKIQIYECFTRFSEDGREIQNEDVLKLEIPKKKWQAVKPGVSKEFKARLREMKAKQADFPANGDVVISRTLGKELMILLWGIENLEVSDAKNAVVNWLGLRKEERWWLYTMTDAQRGGINQGDGGWRQALRWILREKPKGQTNIYDMFGTTMPDSSEDKANG